MSACVRVASRLPRARTPHARVAFCMRMWVRSRASGIGVGRLMAPWVVRACVRVSVDTDDVSGQAWVSAPRPTEQNGCELEGRGARNGGVPSRQDSSVERVLGDGPQLTRWDGVIVIGHGWRARVRCERGPKMGSGRPANVCKPHSARVSVGRFICGRSSYVRS